MIAETAAEAWSPWFVLGWVAWFGFFAAWEYIGLRREHDPYPPLTQVVHRWIPLAVVGTGLLWLLAHAWETYQGP